jgi:sugar phosphate isomerase/epimerase
VLYTRRDLGKLALAVPAAGLLPRLAVAQTKPNSLISGVQIGLIAPYSFGRDAPTADAILQNLVTLGISAVELQSEAAEPYAGAPAMPRFGGPGGPGGPRPGLTPGAPGAQPAPGAPAAGAPGAAPGPGRPPALTPEQQAARQEAQDALKKWRLSASMDKYKELRRTYNDAGVRIYAFKLALTPAMSDDEYEYTFNVAEALGADHLTMELPADGALTKRIGEFAAKRKMMVGYHTHTQATLTVFDEALAQSKYNGINVDIGHYVAGTSESPVPLIRRHHARFTSIHLKDRKKANGPNMPWGQGDTPIAEVLQLMKKEKWTFPATIELEYPVPEGSTRAAEIAKCLQFCRDALGRAT